MKKYDIAAYVWPAYTGKDNRSKIFWDEGIGEWQTVKNAKLKPEQKGQVQKKPLWGYVEESDPYIMAMQIDAALDHGVNIFIYDWYWYDNRPFLENCLNDGFLKAKNKDKIKFYIMWANHGASHVWDIRNTYITDDIWSSDITMDQWKTIADRWVEKYFVDESYYKIDGNPIVMIYDIFNLYSCFKSVEKINLAFKYLREKAKKFGFNDVHIQLCIVWEGLEINASGVDYGNRSLGKTLVEKLDINSYTHYQFCHFTKIDRDYLEILEDVEKEYYKIDKNYSLPYFPHVSVGWDNNLRYKDYSTLVTTNNSPSNFEKGLLTAKKYVDNHLNQIPLITINSWNEWTENSYLQPDNVNGYGYLEKIKKVFKSNND